MITYATCDKCGGKFKSPLQIDNLESSSIQGNTTNCPLCGQITLIENRNLTNQ